MTCTSTSETASSADVHEHRGPRRRPPRRRPARPLRARRSPSAGSGVTSSTIAAANGSVNQTAGGSSSQDITRERDDAGQAAGDVQRVGRQRRPRRHLPRHALRRGGEQRRHGDEQHGQQQRGLDRQHRIRGAAREVDAARRRNRDLEPERVDRADHRRHQRPGTTRTAATRAGASRQPTPMPEKAGEQDEIREVRQQPDVGRHPADESDLDEQDEEGGEED